MNSTYLEILAVCDHSCSCAVIARWAPFWLVWHTFEGTFVPDMIEFVNITSRVSRLTA